jgi:GNAT superfamily N-acetyltransferase
VWIDPVTAHVMMTLSCFATLTSLGGPAPFAGSNPISGSAREWQRMRSGRSCQSGTLTRAAGSRFYREAAGAGRTKQPWNTALRHMTLRTTIRRATEADVEAMAEMLAALSSEIGYQDSAEGKVQALRRHGFGETALFRAMLADRDGRAMGLAVYFPEFSTYRGQPGVYVQDIYLRPRARAGGLGRRLLGAVVRDAAEWEAAYLRLTVHQGNDKALAFYARLGFQTDPRERPHWIEGRELMKLGKIA